MRRDLTNRNVLFYKKFAYLIVYKPEFKPLRIFGILHGSRNIARILRRRLCLPKPSSDNPWCIRIPGVRNSVVPARHLRVDFGRQRFTAACQLTTTVIGASIEPSLAVTALLTRNRLPSAVTS